MAVAGPSKPPGEKFTFTQDVVQRFRPAALDPKALAQEPNTWQPSAYKGYYPKPLVESLCFDDAGEQCVVSGEDESFSVWDAMTGVKKKSFYSRKYGLSHIRYMHHRNNILHASTRLPSSEPSDPIKANAIRYHSTHDNKYLTYFHGHTARALLNSMGASCIAAYDNTGEVFVVACSEKRSIALYPTQSADGIPFTKTRLVDPVLARESTPPRLPVFTSISVSTNGDFILLGTSSDVHYVLDAFTLHIHARLVGHKGLEYDITGQRQVTPRRGASGHEVSFTSDSKWVISGSADGRILAWDISALPGGDDAESKPAPEEPHTLQAVVNLQSSDTSSAPTTAVRMSPRYGVMAVGSDAVSFWLPSRNDTTDD